MQRRRRSSCEPSRYTSSEPLLRVRCPRMIQWRQEESCSVSSCHSWTRPQHGTRCTRRSLRRHRLQELSRRERSAQAHLLLLSPLAVSYTHLRAHETRHDLVCRLLLEKKNKI